MPLKKIKGYLIDLWKMLRLPEMQILPGNLAFFLMLSLAPLITLFGFVASLFSLSTENVSNFFGNVLPNDVINILMPFLNGNGLNAGNIIFMIIGFYTASNGTDSLITASNILYQNKNDNYIKRKIKALFMNIWLLLLFVFILIIMAFGSFILTKILAFSVIGKFILNNYLIITAIKLLFAFLIIYVTMKIIYTMCLDGKIKSKYVSIGSLFATLTIMIVTSIYSFYVTNIAHYDIIYGSLSSIVVLMFLIYFISYIIVLGIVINCKYYKSMNNNN